MPAIVALAVRSLIQMAITLGIVELADRYVLPLINSALTKIIEIFGVSEDTAKDIMANEVIQYAENVGIGALVLRSKLPTKIAERLGFSAKGYTKRKINPSVEAKLPKTAISSTTTSATIGAELEEVATAVSKSSGWAIKGVSDLLKYVTLLVGTPVGFFYALAQFIDYGAWQNPYQPTFQALLKYIGINPETGLPKANTISAENWKRIYSTIEELKPLGISLPFSGKDVDYSRENLAKLIDEIAANMVKVGTNPTYKNVIAAALLQLQFGGKEPKVPVLPDNSGGNYTALAPGQFVGTTLPTTKVFTGIVSQGVVRKDLVFTPRQDDLIENEEELRHAAANNLAPFLQALLGKIVYEVKVVASIITKDGFKQTGTTQRVQTGTFAGGQPKYKTVTNKFATLVVYALTDKGTRAKLTTIVLGPVNSAKLTVGQDTFRELETSLPSLVTTTDVNEISNITPPAQTPPAQITNAPVSGITVGLSQNEIDRMQKSANEGDTVSNLDGVIYYKKGGQLFRRKDNALVFALTTTSVPATSPDVSGGNATGSRAGATAATLFEWYQAQGQTLPSVSERSTLYEGKGLGPKSFYTGTAEQNTKLLNALKST